LEVVAALVEECKASTTAVTVNGQTGLHLAILRAHIKLSKGLIKLGFDVNIADKEGKTPLDLAYEKKLEPVIVELKNAGAAHRAYLTPKSNRSIASTQRSGVSKSQ
jgi:ankyrin repeat protein